MKLYLAVILFFAHIVAAVAQTSAGVGAISGVVTDPAGSNVEGAAVVVENTKLGIHRELRTTGGGLFNAPSLVPNSGYLVTVNAASFSLSKIGTSLFMSVRMSVFKHS